MTFTSQHPGGQAVPCPVCGASVVPTEAGLYPPHPNRAGHRCLGPEGRSTEPDTPTAPGPTRTPGVLPRWIRDAARMPSAGLVAVGLALILGGPVLGWVGLFIQWRTELETQFEFGTTSSNQGGTVLAFLGGLAFLAGIVVLTTGLTRLAAKADVAFHRRLDSCPDD